MSDGDVAETSRQHREEHLWSGETTSDLALKDVTSNLVVSVMYQRNSARNAHRPTRAELAGRGAPNGVLALTFGTLLSSQGADAHRITASRPFSGQPE